MPRNRSPGGTILGDNTRRPRHSRRLTHEPRTNFSHCTNPPLILRPTQTSPSSPSRHLLLRPHKISCRALSRGCRGQQSLHFRSNINSSSARTGPTRTICPLRKQQRSRFLVNWQVEWTAFSKIVTQQHPFLMFALHFEENRNNVLTSC